MTSAVVPSDALMRAQRDHNAKLEADHESARLHNVTIRSVFADIHRAVKGVLDDTFRNTASAPVGIDVLTSDDRMRGLGFLMVVTATVLLFVDAVAGAS